MIPQVENCLVQFIIPNGLPCFDLILVSVGGLYDACVLTE